MKRKGFIVSLFVAVLGMVTMNVFAQNKVMKADLIAKAESNVSIEKEFHITEKATFFKGQLILHLADDVLTLSYVNRDLENVKFSLKDELGVTLFTDTSRKKAVMHHRLNLNELPEGVYSAYLKVGSNFYTKEFSVIN